MIVAERESSISQSKRGHRTEALTQYGEGGVGRDGPRCVFGGAAVHAHVLRLDVHDEEDVVIGHDVHPALACGREIRAPVLLPGDLRRRVALGGALQPGCVARPDGAVPGGLHEGGENCGQTHTLVSQCGLTSLSMVRGSSRQVC